MTSEEMNDMELLVNIISTICDYAIDQQMQPDDVLTAIAYRILEMLKISTFNGWKKYEREENEHD